MHELKHIHPQINTPMKRIHLTAYVRVQSRRRRLEARARHVALVQNEFDQLTVENSELRVYPQVTYLSWIVCSCA
jgi:hypothetical protein